MSFPQPNSLDKTFSLTGLRNNSENCFCYWWCPL